MELHEAVAPAGVVAVDPAVLAETRAFNEQLQRVLAGLRRVDTLPPEVTRQARREGRGAFPAPVHLPQARDLTIPARGGDLRLRVLAPEGAAPSGVYLHLHGGGWTLGAADMQDPPLWTLVEATGMAAVSVDYRLAPEHPFPAGPTTARTRPSGCSSAAPASWARRSASPSAASRRARTWPRSPCCGCATATASAAPSPGPTSSSASTT